MNLTEEKCELEASISHLTSELEIHQGKLAEINKQLGQQPKEGEWWYWEGLTYGSAVSKIKKVDGYRIHFTELYTKDELFLDDWFNVVFLKRPATTSDIEYFMGLHAERLGIKEGAVLKDESIEYTYKLKGYNKFKFENGVFKACHSNGNFYVVRNDKGVWDLSLIHI